MKLFPNTKNTYWENVASTRWGRYISSIEEQAVLRAHQMAGRPSTALDIGCEGGRWARFLSDLGWEMVCIDINKETLQICQIKLPTARCIHVQPEDKKLPCGTATLGLILCIEVHPVIESDWFLPEAHRTLSNAGLIVGVALNKHSLRGLFVAAKEKMSNKGNYRHYQYSYARRRRELRDNGFHVLYERGLCWLPFSRASNSLLIPPLTVIEKLLGLNRLVNLSPRIVFIAQKTYIS